MDISCLDFNYKQQPVEITRENWIIATFNEETSNTFFELHYCPSGRYKQGYLIDDVWSESDNVSYLHKVDIYIVKCDQDLCKDFCLRDIYSYFLKCKDVKKTCLCLDKCDDSIKRYIGSEDFRTKYEPNNNTNVISIITTVYNNADLLEQTIQSVINQTSGSFEYIVKDANSNDRFKEVISKYSDCDIKVISKNDKGIYDGMHQGFVASLGKYLQILNSDDMFKSSNIVSLYINEISKTNSDGYCSDIYIRFPSGKTLLRKADLSKLYYRACVNHTSLAIKREAYFEVGGFDLSYGISADYDLTIKLVKAGYKIQHIDLVCVNFRGEGASNRKETFSEFLESLKCRYRYHPLNIIGYGYVLLRKLKYILQNR